MLAQKDIVVKLIMWEIGKSYADSIKEFDRTVEYIYATIDALKDLDRQSSRFEIEQGIVAQVRRSPLGVVLCMGPFNYPLNETFTTLIPAIIMGNTLLFKPPKHGTLLHFPLLEAFKDCFPKGVVNTIYGRGHSIVPALMQSGKINVLTLIGSSKVANQLKKLHPKVNRLRAILGLDAKNAAIITKHADIKLAVSETVLGALSFNGQRCTALKIIFVHKDIAREFLHQLKEAVGKLKYGMPWEEGVTLTPLPEPNKPLIGSSKVANQLKKLHPKVNRLRAILGLDAKNAAIITKHADIKLAVSETVLGALSFNGQRCTALKIIFVHKDIAREFLHQLKEAVGKLKYGMPWEEGVTLTPLPEPNKPAYLKECIDDAIAHGAEVINENGGATAESFVYPAIVYPVNEKMKLYREEQFGPVIPVIPFTSLEEPIEYLIGSPHGQQVSIFSNDREEVATSIDQLVNQVSRVNINCQCQRGPDVFPFTGRKDSAEGTLSVVDALRSFSIRSLVATKLNENNKHLLNDIVNGHESNFLSTKFIF
jgi:acyl-CoA reductase-like NAD-dependent aldehyde dehydrogenase